MQLSVIGLNHNTASVDVRECMAIEKAEMELAYSKLLSDPRVTEAVILSTCNRVEYYIVTKNNCDKADVLYLVATCMGIGVSVLRKHTYIECGTQAVAHMVAVASGIDSLVLGEPQIFGQVKDAFRNAREMGALGAYLNRLEQFVLKTTKKVRTDTGISENAVSVSYAAVALAKKIFGSLENKHALIIGAGEMCELAAEHLEGAGIGSITVTNRTYSKAEDLARRFQGRAVEFGRFAEVLDKADIVISSTGAPNCVVSAEMVNKAIKIRKKAPMFFIDIAVPRDIDPEVNKIPSVYLYDIDDLKSVVEANRKTRESEAQKARDLIMGSVAYFERSIEALGADPLIVSIRERMDELARQALKQHMQRYKITDAKEIEALEKLSQSITAKFLHSPVKNIHSYFADKKEYTLSEATKLLFDIKEN